MAGGNGGVGQERGSKTGSGRGRGTDRREWMRGRVIVEDVVVGRKERENVASGGGWEEGVGERIYKRLMALLFGTSILRGHHWLALNLPLISFRLPLCWTEAVIGKECHDKEVTGKVCIKVGCL